MQVGDGYAEDSGQINQFLPRRGSVFPVIQFETVDLLTASSWSASSRWGPAFLPAQSHEFLGEFYSRNSIAAPSYPANSNNGMSKIHGRNQ